jgi:hypothetical protein
MSAIGKKLTSELTSSMSAFGGKADMEMGRVTPQTNKAADRAALSLYVLAPLTRDDAAVPTIGGDPCPALANRLLPGKSSIGCGQRRKAGAENDCRGKYDLFRIGHCPISFVLLRLCVRIFCALEIGRVTSLRQ